MSLPANPIVSKTTRTRLTEGTYMTEELLAQKSTKFLVFHPNLVLTKVLIQSQRRGEAFNFLGVKLSVTRI
eukprot:2896166-Amphidinium_carterae.1